MALEDFEDGQDDSKHLKNGGDGARPRVSKETHEGIRHFTSNSGLGISEGYNYLIGKCLSDQDILEKVITHDISYDDELNSFEERLLRDIADKYEELGHFPDRQDINEDSDMNGFPRYVMALGDTDRIKDLVNEKYPGVLPE